MSTNFDESDLQALRDRFRERVAPVSTSVTPQVGAVAQPTVQLNVRIPVNTKATLAHYAERNGVSLAVVIARAIDALIISERRP